MDPARKCKNCQSSDTLYWRGDLCNPCYCYLRKKGYARPQYLWTNPIKKRNRANKLNSSNDSPDPEVLAAQEVSEPLAVSERLVTLDVHVTPTTLEGLEDPIVPDNPHTSIVDVPEGSDGHVTLTTPDAPEELEVSIIPDNPPAPITILDVPEGLGGPIALNTPSIAPIATLHAPKGPEGTFHHENSDQPKRRGGRKFVCEYFSCFGLVKSMCH